MSRILEILDPYLLKKSIFSIIKKYEIGSYEARLNLRAIERPHYGYCILNAARLAHKLGQKKMSVLEFGVAGGNGLLNIEYQVSEVTKLVPIEIEIYGFDTGEGLPEPSDYRDLMYHWKKGFFKMDVPALKSKLKKSTLILGDIKETFVNFFEQYNPAPIGVIMHDFDFYSSTINAFKLFEGDDKYFLPRIYNYFDDIIGGEVELFNEFIGQRLAIKEFNDTHDFKKFGLHPYLLSRPNVEHWYHQIFIYHNFKHPLYNTFISSDNQQLKLT